MDYLGFLCLGVFASAFAMANWPRTGQPATPGLAVLALTPLLVSGTMLAAVAKFRFSPGLGCFPAGLLIGFMWTQIGAVVTWSNSAPTPKSLLAWTWVIAVCGVTAAGSAIAGMALFLHASAEIATPLQDRVADLREARARANAPAQPGCAAASTALPASVLASAVTGGASSPGGANSAGAGTSAPAGASSAPSSPATHH